MSIEIKEVTTRELMREFIHLPAKIHINHSNWVPPIYIDERSYFNPEKNPLFDHSTTILYVAVKKNVVVGRIMGIINNKYNESHGIADGRFCYLETYEDYEVFKTLVEAVSEWARMHGMKRIIGPLAFSDKDPQGWLIEGYDQPISLATNCNFPYMNKFIEGMMFSKEVDLVVYQLHIAQDYPDFYKNIFKRFTSRESKLK
ncbi:MAG TPA: hypothetical protein VLQ91_02365, partial [Draconibacterium sp.]|nr:hypothetical protein [Draconibacterium sp.]